MFIKYNTLFLFIVFFSIQFSIKAEPPAVQQTTMSELQTKLNELNESLAQLNSSESTDKKNAHGNIKDNSLPPKTNTKDSKDSMSKPNDDEKIKKDGQNKQAKDEYARERKLTDWIINVIDNGTNKDRKYAISQILTIKNRDLKSELGKKLIEIIRNEVEIEVKIKAITVTGEIKFSEALPDLMNSLNNQPEDVSVSAVYAIKRIGDSRVKPALIARLKEEKLDSNSTMIEALIDTLGEFKATEMSGFAAEALKSNKTSQPVREMLVLFLGKAGARDSKDILIEIARDEDESEQIRAFAVNALANLNITEARADIEKITETIESYPFNKKKNYYNLYIYCISALVKLGDDKAFPKFMNALRSDNAVVRLKAVNLVKEVKDKRTIDILKYKMNYDPSVKVQAAARDALKEMGVDVEALKKEGKSDIRAATKTKNDDDAKPGKEDE